MQALSNISQIRTEILAALTVSLALVPEAVAFAFVAGVDPLVGLYAAFIIGFVTSLVGGRPGMISGATGALAVVMVSLVSDHGVEFLFITVVLMGIIQIVVGVFKLGNLIRMVPFPVMLGFVNGLAIVIFLAQLESFKVEGEGGVKTWLPLIDLAIMLGLVALTMLIIYALPKLTKRFPSALAGIVVVSALVILADINTPTVGDLSSISGNLPVFAVPDVPFSFETVKIILPFAFILAGVGLIESLLTLSLIDGLTDTTGQKNRECVAQGVGNVVTGFFGGRPSVSPVIRLYSCFVPKQAVAVAVDVEGTRREVAVATAGGFDPRGLAPTQGSAGAADLENSVCVPLIRLALARSGDKGDAANIGVIARDPAYLPWLRAALTDEAVAGWFAHLLEGEVCHWELPGTHSMNFLLTRVLGGGGIASLRADAQGKCLGQILLDFPVPVSPDIAARIETE